MRRGLPFRPRLLTTRSPALPGSRCAPGTSTANRSSATAEGLLAVCMQHEMDHLVGRMFVDYLSPLKRARLRAKQRKKQRLAG